MALIHRFPVKKLCVVLLLAGCLLSLNGCGSTFRSRIMGSWIGPTMEYEFRSNGDCKYAFRTTDGPRWMTGTWWIEGASDDRALLKFRRSSPSPRETYTFTIEFENDDMIQVSKKRGKYRMVRSDYQIAGRFKGPWKGRQKYPYWLTARQTRIDP